MKDFIQQFTILTDYFCHTKMTSWVTFAYLFEEISCEKRLSKQRKIEWQLDGESVHLNNSKQHFAG